MPASGARPTSRRAAASSDRAPAASTAAAADPVLERVRAICLALPETTERPSHGAPTFFIRGKRSFVMFHDNHHHDGRLALWCNAPPGVQAALIGENPRRYFVPAYLGYRGWVGVRLDHDLDWSAVEDAVELAYQVTAARL